MENHDMNLFDVGGIKVYIEYGDLENIHNHEEIDGSVFIDDESRFPLVAEGRFDSSQTWRFFATYSEDITYKLEYSELEDGIEKTEKR